MPLPWLWSEPLAATHWLGSAFWRNSLNGSRASASRGITLPPTRRSWSGLPICVPKDRVDRSDDRKFQVRFSAHAPSRARFYFDRTACCHRHHCYFGRDVTFCIEQREIEGARDQMH